MLADEASRVRCGAPPRDLSQYAAWRDDTAQPNLDALEFYGNYLIGQTVGLGDALNLLAVQAAMDLEGIPEEDRADLTQRCFIIHNQALKLVRKKAKHG